MAKIRYWVEWEGVTYEWDLCTLADMQRFEELSQRPYGFMDPSRNARDASGFLQVIFEKHYGGDAEKVQAVLGSITVAELDAAMHWQFRPETVAAMTEEERDAIATELPDAIPFPDSPSPNPADPTE